VKLAENTKRVDDLDVNRFDTLVVAGGQGPMFTFETAENLHRRFVEFYQSGRLTAALCHGVAILRYTRLATGEPLVQGKTVAGFANVEEDFADQAAGHGAGGPWPARDAVEDRGRAQGPGANYVQAGLWKGFAIRDRNLVTGQQNFSGGETAQLTVETLGGDGYAHACRHPRSGQYRREYGPPARPRRPRRHRQLRRDQAKLAALAAGIGATVGEPSRAAAADVVVLSVPWGVIDTALAAAGPLAGRIIVDICSASV
jgi:putative intracellular protease/amidase